MAIQHSQAYYATCINTSGKNPMQLQRLRPSWYVPRHGRPWQEATQFALSRKQQAGTISHTQQIRCQSFSSGGAKKSIGCARIRARTELCERAELFLRPGGIRKKRLTLRQDLDPGNALQCWTPAAKVASPPSAKSSGTAQCRMPGRVHSRTLRSLYNSSGAIACTTVLLDDIECSR